MTLLGSSYAGERAGDRAREDGGSVLVRWDGSAWRTIPSPHQATDVAPSPEIRAL